MRFLMSSTLDHLNRTLCSLDFFLSAFGESIGLHRQALRQFAVAEDLDAIARILDNAGFHQRFNGHDRAVFKDFQSGHIDADDLKLILRAALMSPTSKGQRSWQFVVVDDKLDLEKLSDAKNMGSQFLKDAPVAIAVLGDPLQNDCWVEDGSIAAVSMQYQAEDLGLGTCWIQMRGRGLDDGTPADTVIRGILDIPENLSCLCILAVGHWADERKPQAEDRLKWENVHLNKF